MSGRTDKLQVLAAIVFLIVVASTACSLILFAVGALIR